MGCYGILWAGFVWNIGFPQICWLHQRVRKCPTIPTSEAIKQTEKSRKRPTTKEVWLKDDASRKLPAVTCPPGKKLEKIHDSALIFVQNPTRISSSSETQPPASFKPPVRIVAWRPLWWSAVWNATSLRVVALHLFDPVLEVNRTENVKIMCRRETVWFQWKSKLEATQRCGCPVRSPHISLGCCRILQAGFLFVWNIFSFPERNAKESENVQWNQYLKPSSSSNLWKVLQKKIWKRYGQKTMHPANSQL